MRRDEHDERLISERLERVYRDLTGAGPRAADERTRDFCFHMTDWAADLRSLGALFNRPGQAGDVEWAAAVYGFLAHASGHLAAAAGLAGVEPIAFEIPRAARAVRRKKSATEPAPAANRLNGAPPARLVNAGGRGKPARKNAR